MPALVEAANDPNVFVRMLAIGALGDIGGDQVLPIIIKALEDEDLAHIESQYRLYD